MNKGLLVNEMNICSFVNAMTIDERIGVLKRNGVVASDNKELEKWNKVRGLTTSEHLEEYLKYNEMSNDDFNLGLKQLTDGDKKLLSEELKKSEWFILFVEMMLPYLEKLREHKENITEFDFGLSVSPYLYWAKIELSKAVDELDNIVVDEKIQSEMLQSITKALVNLNAKSTVWELHLYKDDGELEGDDSEQRFCDFIKRRFADEQNFVDYCIKYPVVARRSTIKCKYIVDHFKEMMHRLDSNFPNVCKALNISDKNNEISNLKCDKGDTHGKGKFVIEITLSNTTKLMYKPRNLEIHKSFNRLLDWFNTKNNSDLKMSKAFYGDSYTFEEFIKYESCSSVEEVRDYYLRYGAFCALVYILEGNDIHYENLIANGSYPMIIDVETLFQHKSNVLKMPENAFTIAYRECIDSVSGTGLLPILAFGQGEGRKGIDISGLTGEKQKFPYKLLSVVDANSDSMRFDYQEFEVGGANNIPQIDGANVSFKDYVPEIIKGFEDACNTIMNNRDELINSKNGIKVFENIQIRHLIKATQNYARFNEFSSHPNYTQDMIKMERLFFNLWAYGYADKRNVGYETYDLLNDDIPIFYGKTNNKDLITSDGKVIENYFQTNRYEVVRNRVQRFTEREVEKQVSQMRVTLGQFDEISKGKMQLYSDVPVEYEERDFLGNDKEVLAVEVRRIIEVIMESCIKDRASNTMAWNNVSYDDINELWKLSPLDNSLYTGISGPVMLLYASSKVFKDEALLNDVNQLINQILEAEQSSESLSAYYGSTSVLFMLSIMYNDSQSPIMLDEIYKITKYIEKNIEKVERCDWVSGYSGIMKVMLNLYSSIKDEIFIRVATRCADKIISKLENVNDIEDYGFAHGMSGMIRALYEFNKVKKDHKLEDLIINITYLLSNIIKEKAFDSSSWCNGVDGIIEAMLDISGVSGCSNIINEMKEIILNKVAEDKKNDCLCHGNFSDIHLMHKFYQMTGDFDVKKVLNDKIGHVLSRKKVNGEYRIRDIKEYVNVSMFLGISGIGYEMLRMYDCEKVSNVLNLEI